MNEWGSPEWLAQQERAWIIRQQVEAQLGLTAAKYEQYGREHMLKVRPLLSNPDIFEIDVQGMGRIDGTYTYVKSDDGGLRLPSFIDALEKK